MNSFDAPLPEPPQIRLARAWQTHQGRTCLRQLLTTLGPGRHHIALAVDTLAATSGAVAEVDASGNIRWEAGDSDGLCRLLGAGLRPRAKGGTFTRSFVADSDQEIVRGWLVRNGWLSPLTQEEVLTTYTTEADTGRPLPREPNVDYRAGLPVPRANA